MILNEIERYCIDKGFSILHPEYADGWMMYIQTARTEFDEEHGYKRVVIEKKDNVDIIIGYVGRLTATGMAGMPHIPMFNK